MTNVPSLKTSFAQFVIIAFALTILAASANRISAQTKDTQWFRSLERAQQNAKQTGRPLFVIFRCER